MVSSQLERLPYELLTTVVEHVPWEGVLALSGTSSTIRQALASYVFRAVKLTNQGPDEATLQRIAGKYGSFVAELHFDGHLAGEGEPGSQDDEPEEEKGDGVPQRDYSKELFLPALVQDALSGKLLPSVKAARITFSSDEFVDDDKAFDEAGHLTGCRDSIYTFENVEMRDDVDTKEKQYRWRALMAQTWAQLARNGNIKRLIIPELVPKMTSTFFTPEWASFLGRLEEVDICMWGGSNGAGWEANTVEGYLHFESHLDEYFFQHLTNLQRLKLTAADGLPFGTGGNECDAALPLEVDHLPQLRRLELKNIFISQSLAEFILSKSDTLRSVALVDCHSFMSIFMGDWATFFERLDSEGLRLTEMDIRNTADVLFTEEEAMASERMGWTPEFEEDIDVRQLQEKRSKPGCRAFSYGDLDPTYGGFMCGLRENCEAFLKGEDQEAYDKVMALVRSNWEATTSRSTDNTSV